MLCCLFGCTLPSVAQTFIETGKKYPLIQEAGKYVVSGFVPFANVRDEDIYANVLLWTIENVCPQLKEGITEMNVAARSFTCNLALTSPEGSGQKSTYYCRAIFRVAEGKLTYYLSNITVEAPILVIKKITPMEKLNPEKKEAHRQIMDDFVVSGSQLLNNIFDFVVTNRPSAITHWQEISIGKPVKGMTEDECRLAFGKPQTVMEANGEVQWMYNSSFYLFFKDGHVQTIIK